MQLNSVDMKITRRPSTICETKEMKAMNETDWAEGEAFEQNQELNDMQGVRFRKSCIRDRGTSCTE